MISKYTYKNLKWIDLESPTDEELMHVMEEFSIPVLVGEEMHNQSLHSKVDLYANFMYLILHFPKLAHNKGKATEQEIDFVIGKNFIITTHYEFIDSLHEFTKAFEAEAILEKHLDADHAGFLFYHLIKTLYTNTRYQLEDINMLIREAEHRIFHGEEGEMVKEISTINRMLLDFKQALRFHHEVLKSFDIAGRQFFGEKFEFYLSAIMDEYTKTKTIMDTHKEILNDLRETNDSLLANKTNYTIRVLTIITFLILPITAISSIFAMNTTIVFIQNDAQFFSVLGTMLLTSCIIFIYFRSKKWL